MFPHNHRGSTTVLPNTRDRETSGADACLGDKSLFLHWKKSRECFMASKGGSSRRVCACLKTLPGSSSKRKNTGGKLGWGARGSVGSGRKGSQPGGSCGSFQEGSKRGTGKGGGSRTKGTVTKHKGEGRAPFTPAAAWFCGGSTCPLCLWGCGSSAALVGTSSPAAGAGAQGRAGGSVLPGTSDHLGEALAPCGQSRRRHRALVHPEALPLSVPLQINRVLGCVGCVC